MNLKCTVYLTKAAGKRLGLYPSTMGHVRLEVEAEGSIDLWDLLQGDHNLEKSDIIKTEVTELSNSDHHINDGLRSLLKSDVDEVILGVQDNEVFLIPELQDSGLIEFQISNGPAGMRNHSIDVYSYSEAIKHFNAICEHGWLEGPQKVE